MRAALLLAPICLLACGESSYVRVCESSSECLQGGEAGTCRPSPFSGDSFCSYPDTSCPAPVSHRWGVAAGDKLASRCVASGGGEDGGVIDAGGGPADADASPPPPFSVRLGGSGSEGPRAVAQTPAGETVLAGMFTFESELGEHVFQSKGETDIFVVKLRADGQLAWARQIAGPLFDFVEAMGVDGEGNIYVSGSFSQTLDTGCDVLVGSNSDRGFVAKLDPDGACLWAVAVDLDFPRIGVEGSGDLIVAGMFTGPATFGSTTCSTTQKAFVVGRLDADDGHWQWAQCHDDAVVRTLAVKNSDVVLVGTFTDFLSFSTITPMQAENGPWFVVRLNASNGYAIWARQALKGLSTSDGVIRAVSVTSNGSVVACGMFRGTADFVPGLSTVGDDRDAFFVRYETTGVVAWASQSSATAANDSCSAILARDDGSLLAAGTYSGPVELGGSTVPHVGLDDVWIARLEATGLSGAEGYGSAGNDELIDMADGTLPVMAGSFTGSISFDDGVVHSTAGRADVFVVRQASP